MKILNRYISAKQIVRLLLTIAFIGVFSIFFMVNKMNYLLNADLGFNKDSVFTVVTKECNGILPDSLVFSSETPGFRVSKEIKVGSEFLKQKTKLALQFVSANYFDFFNYEILIEKKSLIDHERYQAVYVNELAASKLGICNIDDALGTVFCSEHSNYIICGVIKDKLPISILNKQQSVVYQITPEHLAKAFVNASMEQELADLKKVATPISFQGSMQKYFRFFEDLLYSLFLISNLTIFIVVLGYMGSKYAIRKEKAFYTIVGIGIHVLTLIISKTYLYIIAILGFIAGPLSLVLNRFWLGVYENRVNFGFINLFIFLSILLFSIYVICCPKNKLNNDMKKYGMQINSI